MKNKFFKPVLVSLLFLTCFYLKAGAQNIQADAKLEQSTIRIGDQTFLHLSVHQPGTARVNFPQLTDTLTSKILIVKAGKLDTIIDKNDPKSITVNKDYTITCFDEGTYTIPTLAFNVNGGILKTNELTLQVATVKVDTTKGIYDIKQTLAVTYTFLDWLKDNWYWFTLGIVVVLGIIAAIWYYRKRPVTEKPVIKITAPQLPPHEIALNKLAELKEKKLWQQDEFKAYHSELTDILREYLEQRYLIKAHEKTTAEIIGSLRRLIISDENKNNLQQILTLADLVKFAKEKPVPNENEQSMEQAIGFILNTKPAEQVLVAEGGKEHV